MSNLPPLRKNTFEGKLYERRAATEVVILECLELTFDELCDRAEISARKNPDYIPSEALVYFLRQTKTHNHDAQFGRLYNILQKRIKRVCPRSEFRIGDKDGANAHLLDLQEFVLDDFAERVMCDRLTYEEKLDGFEVALPVEKTPHLEKCTVGTSPPSRSNMMQMEIFLLMSRRVLWS